MKRSILAAAAAMSIVLSWRQFQFQQRQARFGSIASQRERPLANEFAPSKPPNTQTIGVSTACASTVRKHGEQYTSAARAVSAASVSMSISP